MIKTCGCRKLFFAICFLVIGFLSLVSCGEQSSTDEAASHPGDNCIGSIVVTVDPKGPSLDIQQVDPVLSNTTIAKWEGPWSVSTIGVPTYNGGTQTLSGNVKFKWKGTQKLEDVRIGVYSTSGAGLNANAMDPEAPDSLAHRDNCTAYANFGVAIAAGCRPGYTYVADTAADGPETEEEATSVGSGPLSRKDRYSRYICPDCGSVTAKWMLMDTSGSVKYSFSAHVYGTKHARSILNDPRFDNDTATIKAFAYKPISIGNNPQINQAAPLSTVKNGQWFYVTAWYDAPGLYTRNNTTWPPCRDGGNSGNPSGCNITTTQMDNYDFYFVEDFANMGAFGNFQSQGLSYSSCNTGFVYSSGASWMLRWDPAVLQTNDMSTSKAGIGSGANAFKAHITMGTMMQTLSDGYTTDRFIVNPGFISASNYLNRAKCAVNLNYNLIADPKILPVVGDGTNTYTSGTWVQGDINVCKLALKAIGASGAGTRIDFSPSATTSYFVATGHTMSSPDPLNDRVAQKSPNYPLWSDAIGLDEVQDGSVGHYNEQYAWVCIQ